MEREISTKKFLELTEAICEYESSHYVQDPGKTPMYNSLSLECK